VKNLIAASADVNISIPRRHLRFAEGPEGIVENAQWKGLKDIVKLLKEAGAKRPKKSSWYRMGR
jgi:hypothetical protein